MQLTEKELEPYIQQNSKPEDDLLKELSRETHLKVQMPQMLSGNIQGQFLESFSRALKPKRILEIGTFTGYSAICLAKGLTEDGMMYTIDINAELSPMAQKYFKLAGLENKIKLITGDAKSIIPQLDEKFDLVFIDADKVSYSAYYHLIFNSVNKGGYIIADNVLWSGKVILEKPDKDTQAIINFNTLVLEDQRVQNYILPIRDGLNIARKLV